MKRINFWLGIALAITVELGMLGNQTLRAHARPGTTRLNQASLGFSNRR